MMNARDDAALGQIAHKAFVGGVWTKFKKHPSNKIFNGLASNQMNATQHKLVSCNIKHPSARQSTCSGAWALQHLADYHVLGRAVRCDNGKVQRSIVLRLLAVLNHQLGLWTACRFRVATI